jgi:hypothetical protein
MTLLLIPIRYDTAIRNVVKNGGGVKICFCCK